MKCRAALTLVMLVGAMIPACRKDPAVQENASEDSPGVGEPWFVEESARRGIEFVHQSGHQQRHFIPEIVCGGVALFDMNGDGLLDLYLIQGGSILDPHAPGTTSRLYRNNGGGEFKDITDGSGAAVRGYGMGVASGDYNNDGRPDLYITRVGPNVLLRNEGNGRFADVTAETGVGHAGVSSSAAFFDFDRDGHLDLFVLNYLKWSPGSERECLDILGRPDYCDPASYHAPAMAVLYRNLGNGVFADVSSQAGIATVAGTGLGVVCTDFTGDGWPDIFVANDLMPDRLWVNRTDGTFVEEGATRGCAYDLDALAKSGMGVAAADIDDDGDLDVLVCNLDGQSDSLFRNEGNYFADITAAAGLKLVSRRFTRFGVGLLDFNNDGLLDMYVANGRVSLSSASVGPDPYAEPNLLFQGTANGRFAEVQPRGGTRELLVATSRGAAFGDLDNDGGIDIVVVNRDGPPHLLHNIAPRRGHWIMFQVLEAHGRDALGATVSLSVGQRRMNRHVHSASSYASSNDPRVHFGLGAAERVTGVTVRWPDGAMESFGDFAANQIVTLRRQTTATNAAP